jgi:hypothetical protein
MQHGAEALVAEYERVYGVAPNEASPDRMALNGEGVALAAEPVTSVRSRVATK